MGGADNKYRPLFIANKKEEQMSELSMENMFKKQVDFQKILTGQKNLPNDNRHDFRDHICLMAEEVGELAKTDKRWRKENTKQQGDKLDELADIFIVAMNLAIFSGYGYEDITSAINTKIEKNGRRFIGC